MGNSIKVTFKKDVTRTDLIHALDRILNRYGCTACGLNGHGISFIGEIVDPEIAAFQKALPVEIKSIKAVEPG
ncbi:hypothetical protein [Mucilaginibacter sp. PPCGB 2223]|uniref:hypothetical protein n=1 Tax=Mucilaginibacter sp. PPCGB 2223 TaxID=1886027 RepID=UPI0011121B82|nr:hypothetical protein [Mucilaginibacter sp. PPCGB 2223]